MISGERIGYGVPAVSLDGDPAHQSCSGLLADVTQLLADVTQQIAHLLRETPTSAYCDGCLARICGVPYEAIAEATERLRVGSEFQMAIGYPCSGCGRPRITFGVRPPSGETGPLRRP